MRIRGRLLDGREGREGIGSKITKRERDGERRATSCLHT